MFWDIPEPGKAREVLMGKLTEWREVFQQQKKLHLPWKRCLKEPRFHPQPAAETLV
jgi:hypothetical protein